MTGHRRYSDLLPWYVNGTLDADEAERIEAHLPTCAECRRELARCRAFAGLYEDVEDLAPAPHPSRIARLWHRVDAPEPTRPFPWRALALVEAVALILVVGVVGWLARPDVPGDLAGEPAFRTLGAERSSPAPTGVELRVVFAPETEERTIREAVRSLGGRIVDGPSSAGVYTLSVLAGSAPGDRQRILDQLRSHQAVLFAESVTPPGRGERP